MSEDPSLPVRENIAASHLAAIHCYVETGTWFNAADRLSIMVEIRQAEVCQLCQDRKSALSPYAVDGSHDKTSALPDNVVEVIHRIKTDSGRITRRWFDSILDTGMSSEAYIELVGLTATLIILDSFAVAIGVDRLVPDASNLPDQKPAEIKNPDVVEAGAWVPLLAAPVEMGPVGLPTVPNIARAMGLVPLAIQQFFLVMRSHYGLSDMHFDITRVQTEFIAARVSAYNDCFY